MFQTSDELPGDGNDHAPGSEIVESGDTELQDDQARDDRIRPEVTITFAPEAETQVQDQSHMAQICAEAFSVHGRSQLFLCDQSP